MALALRFDLFSAPSSQNRIVYFGLVVILFCMDDLDWMQVRSFLGVVRHGSLSAAARALALTQPTIGRHIAQLQHSLGTVLFTRSPSGLMPTDVARNLLTHAEAMETSLAALVRAANGSDDAASLAGTVRISASEIMGLIALPPILKAVRFRHPALVIELVLNNRVDDLLRRKADIAIRMARPTQAGIVARKLGKITLRGYAHRDYAEKFGLPSRIEDLSKFHLIGFDRDNHSARMVTAGKLDIDRKLFSFRCDHDAGQLAALKAGLGIGIVQSAIGDRDGELVPVLADNLTLKLECWICIHEDHRGHPAIDAVKEALAGGLRRWIDQ